MTVHTIEFSTERLAFRVWQDQHRGPFAALNSDPEVMRYFPALVSAVSVRPTHLEAAG